MTRYSILDNRGAALLSRRESRRGLHEDGSGGFRFPRQSLVDPPERCERLTDDLIHVVVTIGRQPSDEPDVGRRQRQTLVFLKEFLVFRARDRVVRIAFGAWVLVRDRRARIVLPGHVLILADAGVILRLRIVHGADRLEPSLVQSLVLEAERPVGQATVAEAEIL